MDSVHDASVGEDASDIVSMSTETMAALESPGVPPHKLRLHVGMWVIVLRNLAPDEGVVNGSTGEIVRLEDRLVVVLIGKNEYLLPRINFNIQIGRTHLHVLRRQFPVRPAYALTIHKSQGQTLDRVFVLI